MQKITPEEALEYHHLDGRPGKISVTPTKPLETQRDLCLAYTPGVAVPVLEIEKDPELRLRIHQQGQPGGGHFQWHGHPGTGQPRPAGLQAGDGGQGGVCSRNSPISTCSTSRSNAQHCEEMIQVVAAIAPTFGGINLEDIRSPECFEVEANAAGDAGYPRLPRRPARHGHHPGGGPAERAGNHRQEARRDQGGLFGGRGGRHRLRQPAASTWACRAATSG